MASFQPRPLPRIMVAPNGARRSRIDHPALPVTDDQIVDTWAACAAAGAGGLHVHIRDADGRHLLDADRYRALLDRLEPIAPDAYLQVTSESADRYSAVDQRAMIKALKPDHVSVALREMVPTPTDWPAARDFYHWAADNGVAVQHIVYKPKELSLVLDAIENNWIPGTHHLMQMVLGTYTGGNPSMNDLDAFVTMMEGAEGLTFDWMLCAFGQMETNCLTRAVVQGGKARVGFENSVLMSDGSTAPDNAARVTELIEHLRRAGLQS